ncbi:MAG TPA: TAT-variant-translocated molybdopterin oxidoreductase [Stellaceae bacterium]|nr:TAT-variant-translocated molybdopterin oxidoreductase [Stellaceae bacterium]
MNDGPDPPPGGAGHAFWQSLDELAQSPDFLRRLEQRFPDEYARLAELAASIDRRRFLQLTAATLALSGLAACGPAPIAGLVIPYVDQPEDTVPGKVRLFASALTRDGLATGILARQIMARPINIEGNPDHPASLGASDAIMQATVLDLYDPDRSKWVIDNGEVSSADALVTALVNRMPQLGKTQGEGLRVLTRASSSPTLSAQFAALTRLYPRLRRHHWHGGWRDNLREASRRAFGRVVAAVPKLDKADIILAVDSDLLNEAPGHLAHARAFARRRRELASGGRGNRLYAIESTPTVTGANADHRFVVAAAQMEPVLRALAAHIGIGPREWAGGAAPSWLPAVAADLAQHKGRALVHVGPYQSVSLHLLGHAINAGLGAFGQTLEFLEPPELDTSDEISSLSSLVADMHKGEVDTLLILGGNPAFTAPPDLGFDEALKRVKFSLHLATHVNETTRLCRWHLPRAQELERWSDARAFDGTATIVQPQIEPLYGGWSEHELLAVLGGAVRPQGHDIVQATWQGEAKRRGIADFATFWREAVRAGVVPGTRSPAAPVTLSPNIISEISATGQTDPPALSVLFRPDPWLRDGRYANNGWLQELPRPLTKLTWDNAVLVAPALAKERGLANEDVVAVETEAGRVKGPVWVMPGQAADAVTVLVGFGRRVVGRVGAGTGFDGFPLRSSNTLTEAPLRRLAKTDQKWPLATTQVHQHIHDPLHPGDILRFGTVEELRRNPDMFKGQSPQDSLYPAWPYPRYAWAMAINLSSCIGCASCTMACAAENNIPVVGKDQVLRDREMHWIRVDRYYRGDENAPTETLFQPVPCMHCEDAPCEVVCPVEATMHDHDGLNVMVYNRCVGTRFCSNNCPYKVRRFNWINYTKRDPRLDLAWNPDLTVRARGVMEKCTYCIQRIREAEITADREGRRVRDGEVRTACQAACPTEAIVFGDQNDAHSAVRKRKDSPLDYGMLEGLNTKPRTTYEARITNPNPALAEG